MNSRLFISLLLSFLAYIVAQVLIFQHIALFGLAIGYLYVGFLLLLPFELAPIALLLIGFFCGLTVDVFYDTPGIHASASVLLSFLRIYLVKQTAPTGGYEAGQLPTIRDMGLRWFLVYSAVLVVAHHLLLFLIEASDFSLVGRSLFRAGISASFTLMLLITVQYLFYPQQRTRRRL